MLKYKDQMHSKAFHEVHAIIRAKEHRLYCKLNRLQDNEAKLKNTIKKQKKNIANLDHERTQKNHRIKDIEEQNAKLEKEKHKLEQ